MPSVTRFLIVVSLLSGIVLGGLYVLSVYYEPELKEETKSLPAIKIRKE